MEDDWPDFATDEELAELRGAYASALGEFLVAFNAVEIGLGAVIAAALHDRLSATEILASTEGNVRRKSNILRILSLDPKNPHLAAIRFERILSMISVRNILAHGHFEQNPYDGSHTVVPVDRSKRDTRYQPPELAAMAAELREIAAILRDAELMCMFDDLDDLEKP